MSLSSDLILVLDHDLFILHVNDTLLFHFGLESGAVKGFRFELSPLAPLLTGIDLDRLSESLNGVEHTIEIEVERGSAIRVYRARMLPLIFETGGRGVGLILEDITGDRRHQQELELRVHERTRELEAANEALEHEVEEHRRTESRLAESRRTIKEIIETAPNLVYVYDVETTRLQYATANLTVVLGYPSRPSWADGGIELLPLVHPDDRVSLKGHVDALGSTADGDVREIEIRLKHALGHFVILRCREVVFKRNETGQPRLVIGTAEDVTELRRSEVSLRTANRQLQLLNKITRHDILNGLNVLAGSLRLARDAGPADPSHSHLERAERAVETVRRQITFTRDYQSIGALAPSWQNVTAVVGRSASAVDPNGVTVETDGSHVEVYADCLLEKVTYALIDNAVRHGGPVTTVRFSYAFDDDGLVIVCEDDGVGIPDDEKTRIFDRAFGKNFGYGLFLAREILAITGLSIAETGRAGMGARFEIRVPHGLFREA